MFRSFWLRHPEGFAYFLHQPVQPRIVGQSRKRAPWLLVRAVPVLFTRITRVTVGISTASTRSTTLLTSFQQSPRRRHGASGTVVSHEPQHVSNDGTTASVMPLQIPDPPPVQNKTFPLKISSLKIDLELTIGKTKGVGAIVGGYGAAS